MITKIEAVVLKGMKYGDSSKIVTLYSREFGKLSVIAKGARSAKNKFGSALQPMNHVAAVIYKKEHRDLHLVSQCDLIRSFYRLSEDTAKSEAALTVLELVHIVAPHEESNPQLFAALIDCLSSIHSETIPPRLSLYIFETALLEIMGFRPNLFICVECASPLPADPGPAGRFGFSLSREGVLCSRCGPGRSGMGVVSAAGLEALRELQRISLNGGELESEMSEGVVAEVGAALRHFAYQHIPGFRQLKTELVFSGIAHS